MNMKELRDKIVETEERSKKHDPNSIMGVHYTSKLCALKRQLSKLELSK